MASPFGFPRIIASCRFAFRMHEPHAPAEGPGYTGMSGLSLANVTFHKGLSSGHLRPYDFLRELWLADTLSSSGYYFFGSLAISAVEDRGSRGKRGCEFGSVRRDENLWLQI